MPLTPPVHHVALVGAGMAGAIAAHALTQAGYTVTVFEKSRGVGGRMSTRRQPNWQADHGAQYFTVKDAMFGQSVAQWQARGWVAPWRARVAKRAPKAPHDVSPSDSVLRWVATPTMPSLAKQLLSAATIQHGHTVSALTRQGNGCWQLHTAEHGTHPTEFHAVLLALPLPQLVTLMPRLPAAWVQAWQSIRFEPCWAVMAQYAQPLALPFDGLFANHSDLQWAARNLSKPGRTGQETWTLHATPAFSQAHLESAPHEVAEHLCRVMGQLGAAQPAASVAHRWRYALAVTDNAVWPTDLAYWDAAQGLGVCGDWLAGGRVEGAWRSGAHLAQQLTQSTTPPSEN